MSVETKKSRIAVAVHSYGYVSPIVYANHIAVFSSWAKHYEIVMLSLDGVAVAKARNTLVETAQKQHCTHILFIDVDHIISESLLPCLLGNTDAAVVSGLITRRDKSRSQVGFVKQGDEYHGLEVATDGMSYAVDACAFGCTLIDMSVFNNIEKPYFKDIMLRNNSGELVPRRSDIQFCDDVKLQGKTIRIDTRAKVGHLCRPEVIYPEDKQFQLATYKKAASLAKMHNLKTALDLGCGFGRKLVEYIKPVCYSVTGVDRDACISYCKNVYGKSITWLVRDFEVLHQYIDKFQLVICADVLEHMLRPKFLLETIVGSMQKDARTVISTPDVDTISEECHVNQDHKQFWNKEDFVKLLNDSGLIVDTVDSEPEFSGYLSTVCCCRKR